MSVQHSCTIHAYFLLMQCIFPRISSTFFDKAISPSLFLTNLFFSNQPRTSGCSPTTPPCIRHCPGHRLYRYPCLRFVPQRYRAVQRDRNLKAVNQQRDENRIKHYCTSVQERRFSSTALDKCWIHNSSAYTYERVNSAQ